MLYIYIYIYKDESSSDDSGPGDTELFGQLSGCHDTGRYRASKNLN